MSPEETYKTTLSNPLSWPPEHPWPAAPDDALWSHPGSNIALDFHGDPAHAGITVLSDGNHHMALEETLRDFARLHPQTGGVFYLTLPPRVLQMIIRRGAVRLGNLRLPVTPHVLISPPDVFVSLAKSGHAMRHAPFMRSRGNVLLVRSTNPRAVRGVESIIRGDTTLFISNPHTEAASHAVYRDTLLGLCAARNLDTGSLAAGLLEGGSRFLHSQAIHHREAPQALAAGYADAAILYYHLALRYTRIFPGLFEMVSLDGISVPPAPASWNVISHFHAGLAGTGGSWGTALLEFLASARVHEIYRGHGLLPADE